MVSCALQRPFPIQARHEGLKALAAVTAGVISVPICRGESLLTFYYFAYMVVVLVDNVVLIFAPVLVLSDRCTGNLPCRPRQQMWGWRFGWLGRGVLPWNPKDQVWGESETMEIQILQPDCDVDKTIVLEQLIIVPQGPKSKNPLAYKWYNAEEVILGKKMKVWSLIYELYLLAVPIFNISPLDCKVNFLHCRLSQLTVIFLQLGLDAVQCCLLAHFPW